MAQGLNDMRRRHRTFAPSCRRQDYRGSTVSRRKALLLDGPRIDGGSDHQQLE
jgi:hypothetical protein